MESRTQQIRARGNKYVKIQVIPGHFATNHSHVNYYVDMTDIKNSHMMAKDAAAELAKAYAATTLVDTIICMEGTEMIGAFLAEILARNGGVNVNEGQNICVVTPELNSNNQMIFRDNMQRMIWDKRILLLVASASTGKTLNRLVECLQYYNGRLVGMAAIFSAIPKLGELPLVSIFGGEDIPDYRTSPVTDCALCREKRKIDAIVNSYGYSKI